MKRVSPVLVGASVLLAVASWPFLATGSADSEEQLQTDPAAVTIRVMQSGFGPAELASIGSSASEVDSALFILGTDTELFDALDGIDSQIAALDREIRDLRAELRDDPDPRPQARSVLDQRLAARRVLIADRRQRMGSVREAMLATRTCSLAAAERIVTPGKLAAPWRASSNDSARQGRLADALRQLASAHERGENVPSDANTLVNQERARPDTARALFDYEQNLLAIEAVFADAVSRR